MKIICIGQNYAEHIKEMNAEMPTEPVLFMKPDSALLLNNKPFYLPEFSKEMHYETELILRISKVGKHIEERFAHRYYDHIGLGIDFTARDLQRVAKSKGLPWEISKAFDGSAVVGEFLPVSEFQNLSNLKFRLDIDGATVQRGNTSDLIFGFDTLISYISKFHTLKIGDLIYTGTPVGVGAVHIGNRLEGFLEDRKMFDFEIK